MNTRVETKHLMSESTSPYIKRLVLMKRSGIPLDEKQKRKLEQFNEVVSMTEVPKYHNRTSPTGRLMKTFGKEDEEMDLGDSTEDEVREYIKDVVRQRFHEEMEEDDFSDELQEIIDELEDELEMDEILDELGYFS